MSPLSSLPLESDIVVTVGTPKHDRRLSDKILSAFNHAYGEGALGVAAVLRRALEEAEGTCHGAATERRAGGALVQADLWVDFIEARDALRRAVAGASSDPEEIEHARADMMDAYKRWSYG